MTNEGEVFVLDSYAVLAFLGGEPGKERVQLILSKSERGECKVVLSLINLGEIAYIVERERGLVKAQEALGVIDQLPIDLLQVNRETVLNAAHIKANYPLAYADAFVVAAGMMHQGVIVTGDPEFERVRDLVEVERL